MKYKKWVNPVSAVVRGEVVFKENGFYREQTQRKLRFIQLTSKSSLEKHSDGKAQKC